jgi:hypothetical protein
MRTGLGGDYREITAEDQGKLGKANAELSSRIAQGGTNPGPMLALESFQNHVVVVTE